MMSNKGFTQITETKGLGQQGLLEAYAIRQASDNPYDKNAEKNSYIGPQTVATYLTTIIPDSKRPKTRILDVGAGTGLVATQLLARGFSEIDALEPSEALLADARRKGVYKTYYAMFLTGEDCGIPTDSYDVVTCSGCFVENHLPKEAIAEMIRMTKPGGHIIICNRLNVLDTVEAYKDSLRLYMSRLEETGQWKKVKEQMIPRFIRLDEGVLWHYSV